ncbi:hypothetical protein Fmac_018845 [Flemingia macrophylla]|uniref:F-box/LRR-repeat protein n=1 Tax=Flemingia macrophylla TaxID=520843 RepID=A0ABD1M668_9FABA
MNGCDMRIPTLVSLSYLTILELSGITFTCNDSNGTETLILNLPVLKKYEAHNCSWLNIKGITFQVPLLEVLFRDSILLDLDLSAARIANANIHLLQLVEESKESMALFTCDILKQFNYNVECLKYEVSKNVYDDHLSSIYLPFLNNIEDFGMLSCLELGKVAGEVLLDFVRKSPFLNTLVIYKVSN